MKKKMFLSVAILAVCVGMSQAAIVAPNQTYVTGTWSGSINTWTMTGNNVDAKYWEYNNVDVSTSTYDVSVPYGAWVNDCWYTQKYTASQLFDKMDLRYSFGFVTSDPAYTAYIDISADNTNWTRVWSMAGGWSAYFPTTLQTYSFAPTTSLYVKHGTDWTYAAAWRMFPSWDNEGSKGGVTLYAVPEPATMAVLGLGGLLALRRKK